jgi:hypothetical protein
VNNPEVSKFKCKTCTACRGYRGNNPIRTIRLPEASTKPILVAHHEQWRRFETP